MRTTALAVLALSAAACAAAPEVPESVSNDVPVIVPTAAPAASEAAPAAPPRNAESTQPTPSEPAPTPPRAAAAGVLPFDPSPADRPLLGATGFTGAGKAQLADGSEVLAPRLHGVRPASGLEAAGVKAGDLLVEIGGALLRPGDPDPVGSFKRMIEACAPDSEVPLTYWREGNGLQTVGVLLGRRPPAYARLATPSDWTSSALANASLDELISSVLALDGGAARFEDTLRRNRAHLATRDPLRLREMVEAHLNLSANEPLATEIASAVSADPVAAARIAGATWRGAAERGPAPALTGSQSLESIADVVSEQLAVIDAAARRATSAWTAEDRTWFAANFEQLTERTNMGEYLYEDEDPLRERANRRTVHLLESVDRAAVADGAAAARSLLLRVVPALVAAAQDARRDGLLLGRDTPLGRIEFWGGGSQRHTNRCAFSFDLDGDDNYLDVAGRADLTQTVSLYVDASGDDLWAATSPFGLAGSLGGCAAVLDLAGDDQYLSRDWGQAAAVAGFALLEDRAGRDVYHAQNLSQGIALAGAAVLDDTAGDDLYTGVRFCQGVGLPGGVGALVDHAGADRYVCTGRYDSEYGEPGLYSGWGQGVGFGFREVASGGIGVLLDAAGDDVYEAGNFSQGGGYFYAWGILWDARGRDRYIGSRYAQGFAAHEAVGTFLEGAGDDLYQSHSGVAQGLSWDETSVYFHEMGGNDRYETGGFSLASAAHNGMVVFIDDGGDDVYAGMPAHARSNDYHGGNSFALFLDRGGDDRYGAADAQEWNDRAAARDDGAYHVDLPASGGAVSQYFR